MHPAKIGTVSAVLLVGLATGCGGSSSSSSASPTTPQTTAPTAAPTSSSPSASSAAAGVPFTSDEWGFSIDFPSEPKQQALNQTVSGVKIDGRVFEGTSGDQDTAVSVARFPAGQSINVDAALRGAITGGASSANGTIVEQHAETFQGHPAREGTIRVQGSTLYYIEAFVAGNRLYNVIGSPRSDFDAAKASFALH